MSELLKTAATQSEIVSDESEPLILVDADDTAIGSLDKTACHDGDGRLHRAFSVFVLNREGALLMQRRHASKRLWPLYWSNSCCSHPRVGETTIDAAHRRVRQELGLDATLEFLFKFEYAAAYRDAGTEHELCSVFVGRTGDEPIVNTTEIDAWRWMRLDELDGALARDADDYTPWLKLEWRRLRSEFNEKLIARAVD